MSNLLSERLSRYSRLQDDDIKALECLCRNPPKLVRGGRSLALQGEVSGSVPFLIKGWVCASKYLDDGRWQTISVFLEGDLCDFGAPSHHAKDYALRAITDTIVLPLQHDELDAISHAHPRVAKAFRLSSAAQLQITRERIVSLGQRKARERCAHLICELFWRLQVIGSVKGSTIEFPLTQEEVGGVIGTTNVHANRVLQELRTAGLIEQGRRSMTVIDIKKLERLAQFSSMFLNLPPQMRQDRRHAVLSHTSCNPITANL